jgi:hypothetical protein
LNNWNNIKIYSLDHTKVYIKSDDLSIYVEGLNKVDFIPYFEDDFQNLIEKELYFSLSVSELKEVLNFLEFYVRNNINTPIKIKVYKNKLEFIVTLGYDIKKITMLTENLLNKEFEFTINLFYLKDILNNFYDGKDKIKIYTNESNPMIMINNNELEKNLLVKFTY